jgi:Putative auto-transporter adhesin, head GIN domain
MTRKLLIVFASGLFFAIVLLSSAWVIGGQEMITRIEKEGGNFNISIDGDKPSGPQVTRSFAFAGLQTLTISAPVTLKFVRGDKAEMVVEGPEKLMNALKWENGELSLEGHRRIHRGRIKVTITAPVLPDLEMRGAIKAELAGLDQPRLSIETAGALDLEASGKVPTLSVASRGASDIDLTDVEAQDATVNIAGAGDVDISATGKVDATISGAGEITLHRKPETLNSKINGAGSIDHDY